jgi:hypothetical protein
MTRFQKARIPASEMDALNRKLHNQPVSFFERYLGLAPSPERIEAFIEKTPKDALVDEVHLNDRYQVAVRPAELLREDFPEMWNLSIKRRARRPVHDWRHLQEIKNQIIGRAPC